MKRILILLFFALTASASAQFAMVGAWQSSATWTPADSAATDSLKGWYVSKDVADSLGEVTGDTIFLVRNRARWLSPIHMGDLLQTTDAKKPIYTDTSGVVFDGTDDEIRTAVGLYAQPNTIIVAMKLYKPATNLTYLDGSGGTQRHAFYHNASQYRNFSGAEYTAGRPSTQPMPLDSTHIWTFVFNGAASYQRINGLQYAAGNSGTQSLLGLVLAAAYNSSGFSNMAFREVIVYSDAAPSWRIARAEAYLRSKYQ